MIKRVVLVGVVVICDQYVADTIIINNCEENSCSTEITAFISYDLLTLYYNVCIVSSI